ncbi:hypothetical protein HMI48_05110 [Acidithiobacillus ferrooxidans]|jgi:hypothetical protein|uniref:hypothetical protein n=1 Tax=Acidithiobacillus ferrooxidans TaxID=920 RepID=UPI001C07DAB1|nr:hypothetical protein [Acidithiobacillus ferrooxidans]MBU2773304.1 hypothetical protein [Acidithiobacillus ferrooxidans]
MERSARVESESIIEDRSQGDPDYGAVSANPDEDARYKDLLAQGRSLEVKVLVGFVDFTRLSSRSK